MKTYRFEQLSDQAKLNAIDAYRQFEYAWDLADEWEKTLREFCDHFGIKLQDWSISTCSHSFVKYTVSSWDWEEEREELQPRGPRLATWLYNRFFRIPSKTHPSYTFWEWRLYTKRRSPMDPQFIELATAFGHKLEVYVTHESHIFGAYQECPLTGMDMDYAIMQPMLDFMARPNKDWTWEDLVDECMDNFVSAWVADMEYQSSDEYISDYLTDSDDLYDKDGEPWRE